MITRAEERKAFLEERANSALRFLQEDAAANDEQLARSQRLKRISIGILKPLVALDVIAHTFDLVPQVAQPYVALALGINALAAAAGSLGVVDEQYRANYLDAKQEKLTAYIETLSEPEPPVLVQTYPLAALSVVY